MTVRKPASMTFESFVERQIRIAQERGEFDDLPGAGKPLPDMDQPYDEMWWVRNLMRRENLSVVPPALQLKRDVEQGLKALLKLPNEKRVRAAVKALNVRICDTNRTSFDGPLTSVSTLDVEQVVRTWRKRQR